MTSDVQGWRKPSRSANTDNCVEVGKAATGAAVRDTKDRAGGYLTTTREQWSGFLLGIKDGRYDR